MKIIEKHIFDAADNSVRFIQFAEQTIKGIISRKGIKKAIKRGAILLNGKPGLGGTWLKSGDEIQLIDFHPNPPKAYNMVLEIVYQDDFLAVINKPAGIVVSGNQFKTIQNGLINNLDVSPREDALPWPQPVHRLDKGTSGLLLIARTMPVRIALGELFSDHQIEKTYEAIVIGKLQNSGVLDGPINGQEASTIFKVIESVPSLKNEFLSLVQLKPKSGRKHQLRIHLAEFGFPILGDKVYGEEGMILKRKGIFLCATGLRFKHPGTGEELRVEIDRPAKFGKRLANEERRWKNFP